MTKKELAQKSVEALEKLYTDGLCSLEADNPFHLLIATRLSAQCTDARVNTVTPTLFAKYPDAFALAEADESDVEEIIRSCGFFRQKAKDIVAAAKIIVSEYNGKVPDTMEKLTALPGVGRKTANLILGDVYGLPAVVTDTHLIRIANRLGLVSTKEPFKVEMQLKQLLPPERSNNFCHRCVLHGRAVCTARKPKCEACVLKDICAEAQKA